MASQGEREKLFYFASSQRSACAATFAGAVPPRLVRDRTEASTVSTENTFSEIPGSTQIP